VTEIPLFLNIIHVRKIHPSIKNMEAKNDIVLRFRPILLKMEKGKNYLRQKNGGDGWTQNSA